MSTIEKIMNQKSDKRIEDRVHLTLQCEGAVEPPEGIPALPFVVMRLFDLSLNGFCVESSHLTADLGESIQVQFDATIGNTVHSFTLIGEVKYIRDSEKIDSDLRRFGIRLDEESLDPISKLQLKNLVYESALKKTKSFKIA